MLKNSVTASRFGNELTITITGRFNYDLGKQFRNAYEKEVGVERYVIDFREVTFIDSSALGRLMLLRALATDSGAAIALVNTSEGVRELLKVTQFDKLFEIR